jgi:single-stranded DNA-binding protein
MATTLDPDDTALNLAVLCGTCSAPPEIRILDSGRRLASVSVRTPGPGAHATSVPVTVWDPPAWIETLDTGDGVVVVGTVHRRFFRTAAGARGAKAEVEASYVSRANSRGVSTALRKAEDALGQLS